MELRYANLYVFFYIVKLNSKIRDESIKVYAAFGEVTIAKQMKAFSFICSIPSNVFDDYF